MDSSTFTSENESLSQVETLKQQLNTYKMINADLSKKIQELKVELNAFKHENSVIKREVLEERAKAVEYRQSFTIMNTHCINFINTYVNSMQQINDNDDSLIRGIPGIGTTPKRDDENESPQNDTIVPQTERQRPPQQSARAQSHAGLHDDEDIGSNVLNTILEESVLPFTSTPIVRSKSGIPNSTPKITPINPSPTTPVIPNNMFKSPRTLNSDPVPQLIARTFSLPVNFSPNSMVTPKNRVTDVAPQVPANDSTLSNSNISQTVTDTPRLQVNPSSRRISITREDEIGYADKENETAGDDTTEQTIQHDTIKEVKSCRVALSPLKSAYLQNNNNTITESPEYESFDDDGTIGKSQDDSTLKATKSLKRKSSESGRPRRQARPDPKSLKEPSLRTKLRRSKRKI
ncbi:uncharacterized protein [Chironomus tepperi]|uniref:uncharacterized protein n=1 Tax=Chironomus tepperi TaxID=113505 RepID=UPI00391F795D